MPEPRVAGFFFRLGVYLNIHLEVEMLSANSIQQKKMRNFKDIQADC